MSFLLGYAPFLDPLPIWHYQWGWPLLLLPLCAAVAIVYKSIRCSEMKQVPWEGTGLLFWIIFGMCATASALAVLAKWMSA